MASEEQMATTASAFKLVRCPSCGTLRTISKRHARRKTKGCRMCSKQQDMRGFWLEMFSDDEICLMVESIVGAPLYSLDRTLVASARSSMITTS